ncbi:MAG TPA: winged helix-turn-helix transcriptional regulator [Candidatus Deferrimicrobium sp.]|nr:winged helix-turn-helix transcriptional regulator [Candidatus Deferrimicrobium sp.]
MSDEDLLRIIAHYKQITQSDLQRESGLAKSLLSLRVNRLLREGKIKVTKVRRGKAIVTLISLATAPEESPAQLVHVPAAIDSPSNSASQARQN